MVPFGVSDAVEWYIRGIGEAGIPADENRFPAGAVGS